MLTLKQYTVRPNSDLMDVGISTPVEIAGATTIVERTIQISQSALLAGAASWSDADLVAAVADHLGVEIDLPPTPQVEVDAANADAPLAPSAAE